MKSDKKNTKTIPEKPGNSKQNTKSQQDRKRIDNRGMPRRKNAGNKRGKGNEKDLIAAKKVRGEGMGRK